MPFISQDREYNTDWIDQEFVSLVPFENMTRYDDGLLPGHAYMLYWIRKYKSGRRIPAYFEYDYGIEFMKEREFLKDDTLSHRIQARLPLVLQMLVNQLVQYR